MDLLSFGFINYPFCPYSTTECEESKKKHNLGRPDLNKDYFMDEFACPFINTFCREFARHNIKKIVLVWESYDSYPNANLQNFDSLQY